MRTRDVRKLARDALAVIPIVIAIGAVAQRPGPLRVVFATAAAMPWILFFRGIRLPRIVTAVVTFAATAGLVLIPVPYERAPLFLVFLVAAHARLLERGRSVVVLVAAVAMMLGFQAAGWLGDGAELWSVTMVFAWLAGVAVQLQERVATEARRARRAAAERAAMEERSHVARELHDAIGRSVAVMMLHVGGARRALTRDPDDAARALELAEEAGRSSMVDIRRTVELLGIDAERPGAREIPDLVEQFTRAGMSITSRIDGDLDKVPGASGHVLYRALEESLTNAAKHAADVPVTVELAVEARRGELRVRNPLLAEPNGRGGHGLRGMEERARRLGGTITAGPIGGEWRVELSIPLEARR